MLGWLLIICATVQQYNFRIWYAFGNGFVTSPIIDNAKYIMSNTESEWAPFIYQLVHAAFIHLYLLWIGLDLEVWDKKGLVKLYLWNLKNMSNSEGNWLSFIYKPLGSLCTFVHATDGDGPRSLGVRGRLVTLDEIWNSVKFLNYVKHRKRLITVHLWVLMEPSCICTYYESDTQSASGGNQAGYYCLFL